MITTPLTGNMGDQLRFYTLLRIIADKNGYEWGVNPHPEYSYMDGVSQLDFFDIDYGVQHGYTYAETPPWATNVWYEKYEHFDYENGDKVDFHKFQPDVFEQPDNTKFVFRCVQTAEYFSEYKEKIKEWLVIREDVEYKTIKSLFEHDITLDQDLCVINVRGGEFKTVSNLILQKEYWNNAIQKMQEYNPNMRFMCVSDDPQYCAELFNQSILVAHLGIGEDYFILNHAKNLILSNSGFAIFPTWLNKYNPYVIAPRYWARHSVSQGWWCPSDMWTFGWNFLDRDGQLYER